MSPHRISTLALAAFAVASVHLSADRAQDVVRAPGFAMPTVRPDSEMPRGSGLVLGRVVDAASGRPIAGATVTLGNVPAPMLGPTSQAVPSSMTNAEGHFLFRDLPKGAYPVTVTARGYLSGANGRLRPDGPSRPVSLDDNERVTDIVIRLWKHGVISGTVRDERSEPVVGAAVRALRFAGGRFASTMQTQTDDRGAYRLAGLAPGAYYVLVPTSTGSVPASLAAVFRQPGSQAAMDARRDLPPMFAQLSFGAMEGIRVGDSLLSTMSTTGSRGLLPQPGPDGRLTGYQATYHPAAPIPVEARLLGLSSGEDRSDVDINLTMTPMLTVSGSVVGPDGPASGIGVSLVSAYLETVQAMPGLETSLTLSGPDGRFTLIGVVSGQYRLRAVRIPRPSPLVAPSAQTMVSLGGGAMLVMGSGMPDPSPASDQPTLWADVQVDVANRDVTGVTLTLSAGSRIGGHVVFEGGTPPPANEMPRIGIGLVHADDRTEQLPPPAPIDRTTYQFLTAQYPAGRYLVNMTSLPAGWSVRSAIADGVNAFERPLTLAGQDVAGVVVTLTRQPTTLSGQVRRGVATGDPQAVVAVFPADYRAWIEDGMTSRRFRSTAVQPDGTFELSGLGPGEYLAAAVGAEYPVDGRHAEIIHALARVGTRITVGDGVNQTPALTVATIR